ncbi:hypothetical protein [Paenisporosarcina antarctica]|uniref:Uncharacterized protein n=1 Tax=Paenisporosarcina antarctica TaxID=417367 RepID=A0A4P6ZZH8_9BACL|nr:hypothetical protein [Paenisporosarcina antarctica]QBP41981.1 hypothetical protein E2636_12835 [Paenisporosarcina antarctica]
MFNNIITLGASGRIERKVEDYDELVDDYGQLNEKVKNKTDLLNKDLEKLIVEKVNSIRVLKKISHIIETIQIKDRNLADKGLLEINERVDFQQIYSTLTAGEMAINTTKGISTGIGTALGSWALVSSFGAATTGATIATLSGAAATNATLAWFGGGALAAGGGGMALGTTVLGGLVAVPALVAYGAFSHVKAGKKIKEIELEMNIILKSIDQMEEQVLSMELMAERAKELKFALEKSREVFNHEVTKINKVLFPYKFLSKWIKLIRKKVFKRSYYTKKDIENIQYIGNLATSFSILIDTTIVNLKGE